MINEDQFILDLIKAQSFVNDPSHGGKLVKKQIIDKNGHKQTTWVAPEDLDQPDKKSNKQDQSKDQKTNTGDDTKKDISFIDSLPSEDKAKLELTKELIDEGDHVSAKQIADKLSKEAKEYIPKDIWKEMHINEAIENDGEKIEEEKKDVKKKDEAEAEDNQYVEKFRSLSDDQIQFYLKAPYPDVTRAAKAIARERGLNVVTPKEYIDSFQDFSQKDIKEQQSFYQNESKKSRELIRKGNYQTSINTYIGYGFKAIRDYNSDPDNFDSKKSHTSMDKETVKLTSDELEDFINKSKPLEQDTLLKRNVLIGGTFFNSLKEGDVYQDKSFQSVSLKDNNQFGDFTINILAKKGSKVANVDNLGELEYLIQKDSKFRVVEKKDNGLTVELL